MDNETKFIDGIRVYNPNPNAPGFVLNNGVIYRNELIEWIRKQTADQIKFQILRSKSGTPYIKVDDYKPQEQSVPSFQQPAPVQPIAEDDVPF